MAKYLTNSDVLRRRYDSITGSLRFRIGYDQARAMPYVAYVDGREVLEAPFIGAAVEAVARFVLRSASRKRSRGSTSLAAHRTIKAVKTNAHNNKFVPRSNAVKHVDVMARLNTSPGCRITFYSRKTGNRVLMP